jgi:intracellular multiplication protein IcmJ
MGRHLITLTAKPGVWRLFAARKVDPGFQNFALRIWKRDAYTCQFCGFQAKEFQEVINLDGNYRHNTMDNMVTACCFCAQCFFLESVGKMDTGGGVLIYLPDIDQGELNGLCHVLFCAMANAINYRTDAQNIYRQLKSYSKIVEEKLGEKLSNPALLGQALIDAHLGNKEFIHQSVLSQLRLLPSRSGFAEQINAWAQAALREMSKETEAK